MNLIESNINVYIDSLNDIIINYGKDSETYRLFEEAINNGIKDILNINECPVYDELKHNIDSLIESNLISKEVYSSFENILVN